MLLGAHPEACTAGELKLSPTAIGEIDRYRCSCKELIRACPFWKRVREGMARRGLAFDIADAGTEYRGVTTPYTRPLLKPLHHGPLLERIRDVALLLSPSWRRRLPEIQRRNAALAAAVSEIGGCKVVIDSSKSALRLKYLLRNPDLDVKVIRLIRDGRAVSLTYVDPARFADARDASRRGGGMGGDRKDERLSMTEAAYEWRRSNEAAGHLLAHLDRSRWTEVRYEEYCTATQETLNRLYKFLSLRPLARVPDCRATPHHVIGNGMRLDESSEILLDERWRTELSPKALRVFDSIVGKMSRRYGYE